MLSVLRQPCHRASGRAGRGGGPAARGLHSIGPPPPFLEPSVRARDPLLWAAVAPRPATGGGTMFRGRPGSLQWTPRLSPMEQPAGDPVLVGCQHLGPQSQPVTC